MLAQHELVATARNAIADNPSHENWIKLTMAIAEMEKNEPLDKWWRCYFQQHIEEWPELLRRKPRDWPKEKDFPSWLTKGGFTISRSVEIPKEDGNRQANFFFVEPTMKHLGEWVMDAPLTDKDISGFLAYDPPTEDPRWVMWQHYLSDFYQHFTPTQFGNHYINASDRPLGHHGEAPYSPPWMEVDLDPESLPSYIKMREQWGLMTPTVWTWLSVVLHGTRLRVLHPHELTQIPRIYRRASRRRSTANYQDLLFLAFSDESMNIAGYSMGAEIQKRSPHT